MTVLERLDQWAGRGLITADQRHIVAALVTRQRMSLYIELNALLYLGVLAIVSGLAWTVREYFANLGDVAIIGSLTVLIAGCGYYCSSRARPYAPELVASPNLGFDYVLYLGCLAFGVLLGYLPIRFPALQAISNQLILLSAAVYFACAYRFDNRLVLSLALSALAGFFGLSLNRWGFDTAGVLRSSAMIFSGLVAGAGVVLERQQIKPHFFETYLHLAALTMFFAVASGVVDEQWWSLYLMLLLALGAASVYYSVQRRSFWFVGYGTVFPYVAISIRLFDWINEGIAAMFYGVVSSIAVVVLLVVVARRFGREE